MNLKEILKNIIHKNTINVDNATSVGASSARPPSKARPYKKTIFITLPNLTLLIATLIAIGTTNAAGNTATPETEQTFTEEGDGYYIWVRAVDHAGNKGPWSEAQRVWIDTNGPSAPTITGGSSEYALSRTISVATAADDSGASGVAYYEYYKKSGADKPAASVTGTKVTTSTTSQTFNTNTAGEYVFFRAVDVVGNKGAWSDGQQVYIDVNAPKITVKNSSVEVSKGDTTAFSTYFTVDANGTNTSVTTTYTINGTKYDNPSSLEPNTYTVTCTATKTGGNSASETMTLKVKTAGISAATVAAAPSTYSGKTVKGYTCTNSAGVNAWKIFYADSSNIYLIADNYIHYDYTPADRQGTKPDGSGYMMYFSSIYSHYDGSANILDTSITDSRIQKWIDYASYKPTADNANIKSVAYMLDCNVWKAYKDNTYAAYAIGGPTVELFADAYNWAHPGTDIGYDHKFNNGYKVGAGGATDTYYTEDVLNTSDSTYVISAPDRAEGYWLASPSGFGKRYLLGVHRYGRAAWYREDATYLGFRPLVCLESGVKLTDNGDGTYGLTL